MSKLTGGDVCAVGEAHAFAFDDVSVSRSDNTGKHHRELPNSMRALREAVMEALVPMVDGFDVDGRIEESLMNGNGDLGD